ncbi:MAG: hypothetical protein QM809_16925 [Gordonia sp. (in: high G+C Gram-positive bacteria)]|uniref:hypothetical protein n=1 Tax=Gordonia sp. (in: high G+C Gram-positive bacteria) TaxID=84139 RepID=UPI0039E3DDCD
MATSSNGVREGKKTSNSQRWFIRAAAVGILGGVVLNVAVPEGNAELFTPQALATFATPAAEVAKKRTPPKKEPAETYQERQERIADSKRSMLKPLAENKGKDTTCVSGEFTTLDVVYRSVLESLMPSLPPQVQAAAKANQRDVLAWMKNTHVSTLAVSDHPNSLGADRDDPQYRTALSQIVVNNLLKIRDGKQNDAIPVENITLSQAVESVWLYFFVGVLAPIQFGLSMLPGLGSPPLLSDTPLAGFVTYNTLLTLGFTGAQMGLQFLYQGVSNSMINQCVARVTDEQKERAGKPSDVVKYDIPIHPLIQGAANQLALADNDTCAPVGDQPLSRIVKRTGEFAKSTAPNAASKRRIDAQVQKILRDMKATKVPHNMIPADPADFSQAEQLGSFLGSMIPYIGGAPLNVIIGLGHNSGEGKNMGELVSVHDLTVTKSLTAAYYSYALSLWLFSTVGGLLVSPIPIAGDITVAPIRMIAAVLGLPLTYGLVTYHHVIRSMCFIEDDKTGTGLGAEANKKDPEAHARAVAEKKRAEAAQRSRSNTPRSSAPRSRTPQTRQPRSTAAKPSTTTTRQVGTPGTAGGFQLPVFP